ncbi:MAG: hypothetical protein M3R15_18080, partial [Acidobacteriota bacterium]|nr:hypothetical protein [Acidobacteriota bacterium]
HRINYMLVWSAHDVMPSNAGDYITTIMMGKLCYLGARNRLAAISDGAQLSLNLTNQRKCAPLMSTVKTPPTSLFAFVATAHLQQHNARLQRLFAPRNFN